MPRIMYQADCMALLRCLQNKVRSPKGKYSLKSTCDCKCFFVKAEGLGLACRLGRRFCFAEVSTGDPRPSARGFGG